MGLSLVFALSGCQSSALNDPSLPTPRLPPRVYPAVPSPVQFTDITAAAGIHFKHNNGAFGLKLYPETMGSGVAFIDFDGDGLQDLFFVSGRDWTPAEASAYVNGPGAVAHKEHGFALPAPPPHRRTTCALYHNNGNGTFSDVTKGSGLDIEMQGMGVAVGDYDNDGRPDLYVTGYGRNYLFHNEGHGHFKEVAKEAGVEDAGFSTSAMWVDYDRDGKLDLFVCRYINWTPGTDIWNFGSLKKVSGGYLKTYTGPPGYSGQASHLYHNEGNGRFADMSAKAGIYAPVKDLVSTDPSVIKTRVQQAKDVALSPPKTLGEELSRLKAPALNEGKSMGVALCDANNDGWPDILVTNDTVRNYLFLNQKNGTFKEVGVRSGVSYSQGGRSRAGMGVDVGDLDQSGHDSVVVGNFDHEYLGLYQNQGQATFSEIAGSAQITRPSMNFLTFGCLFLDVNNDGWLDILTANGHVQDTIGLMHRDLAYAERPSLYVNRAGTPTKFDEVGLQSGAAMAVPRVARGIACGDVDLDGRVDVVLTINGGIPVLLHNVPGELARQNNALRVTLVGTKSNRSAIGAVVEARFLSSRGGQASGEVVRRMVKSGSSYLSQSELPVTIGMARHEAADLTILWPSGQKTQLKGVAKNQAIIVNEDRGILQRQPLARH